MIKTLADGNLTILIPFLLLLVMCILCVSTQSVLADKVLPAPPNEPAMYKVQPDKSELTLNYNGKAFLKGTISVETTRGEKKLSDAGIQWTNGSETEKNSSISLTNSVAPGDKVDQKLTVKLLNAEPGTRLIFRGHVYASDEAFPAETNTDAQKQFPLVRNSVGLSRNARNNAVYDRKYDWVLFSESGAQILPVKEAKGKTEFSFEVTGQNLELTFRPHFYQKFKNIPYFEPWTYKVWPDSVAGWCSWWAYQLDINEKDVQDISQVFSDKLKDYGFDYIQIDDGYQAGYGGLPSDWLKTNQKFPHGVEGMANTIKSKGLKPAIWINVHFGDEKFAQAHPDLFIRDEVKNALHKGPWIDYAIDGSNPDALQQIVRPTYQGLHKMGWDYVKIDTLRHLMYDAIYPCRDYFKEKKTTGEEAFRDLLKEARNQLGRDTYVLACWGVLPEVVGIADGCRLGGDGFGPTTMGQYNSWNNVVWRNDPDHVDITPDGEDIIRPVLISMAGAQMLLSDKVEIYKNDVKLEGARRSCPVLFTRPGQLYDYDPRKSDALAAGIRNEHGGSGQGPVDADQWGSGCPWWLMEIDRPFETWNILARFNWDTKSVSEAPVQFSDLGLSSDKEYLVYEYWTKKYLGSFKGNFTAPSLDAKSVSVFSIREKQYCPQILSTSRHISQGGVDLNRVKWDPCEMVLSGESSMVKNDPYTLAVYVPMGYMLDNAHVKSGSFDIQKDHEVYRLTLNPSRTGKYGWTIKFHRAD